MLEGGTEDRHPTTAQKRDVPVEFTEEDGKEHVKEKDASTLSKSGRRTEVDINTNKSSKLMMPAKDAVAKVQLLLRGLFSAL